MGDLEKSRTLFPLSSLGTYGCGYQDSVTWSEAEEARDQDKK